MTETTFSAVFNLTQHAVEGNTTEPPGVYNKNGVYNQTGAPASDWADVKESFNIASYIIMPTFLLLGLFGNSVTIVTLMSRSFTNMTSRYILIMLALSDTTFLMAQSFNKLFVFELIGYDARALSDFGCKAFFHIYKTSKMTSSWLIVILCFERFVAVVFPLKAKIIITKKTIIGLIAIDYIFIASYNAVWSFSSLIVNGVCKPDVTFPETKQKFRDFLLAGSFLYSLIPMVIMALLTPIIVIKLRKHRRRRQTMSSIKSGTSSKADSETIRISAMLIGVVIAYVIFILPITVVQNLALWRNISLFDTNTYQFFVLREIAQMLEQFNYSTNFILYVLCSQKFRNKAMEFFKLKTSWKHIKTRFSSNSSSKKTASTDTGKNAMDKPASNKIEEKKYDDKKASYVCKNPNLSQVDPKIQCKNENEVEFNTRL